MNALSYILADRSAMKLPWEERLAAYRGTAMEAECLRSIAKEAEQVGESSFADWCTAASQPVDDDDRDMCLEEVDEQLATFRAIEEHGHRCAMFDARHPDKTWELHSDELRREWDEIRPVRVPYGVGGR